MKKIFLLFVGLLFAMILTATHVIADENVTSEFSYGTVVSASDTQLNVNEYDYEKDEDVQVVYEISDKTEWVNVKSIKDILVGDTVDVIYQPENNSRKAIQISVEKPDNESELDPEETESLQIETEDAPQNNQVSE